MFAAIDALAHIISVAILAGLATLAAAIAFAMLGAMLSVLRAE